MAEPPLNPPTHDPTRLDARANVVWDPMWRLSTPLTPLERALLRLPASWRLHHVVHGGTASLATPYVHSRLQHVLAVFALTAHFAPDDVEARVAALLHDVGHPPFSHALEGVPGVNHHVWTEAIVRERGVAALLTEHHVDVDRVLDLAEGRVPSVLKNREGVLHLDHLDSLVRGGRVRGTLDVPPVRILAGLERDGDHVVATPDTAERLEALVVAEAHAHLDPMDFGGGAMLSALVARLVDAGSLDLERLPRMIDAELTAILLQDPSTADDARRLWFEPWRLRIERVEEGDAMPPGALIAEKSRLYLDLPRVRGRPPAEARSREEALRERLAPLLGRYRVGWD